MGGNFLSLSLSLYPSSPPGEKSLVITAPYISCMRRAQQQRWSYLISQEIGKVLEMMWMGGEKGRGGQLTSIRTMDQDRCWINTTYPGSLPSSEAELVHIRTYSWWWCAHLAPNLVCAERRDPRFNFYLRFSGPLSCVKSGGRKKPIIQFRQPSIGISSWN